MSCQGGSGRFDLTVGPKQTMGKVVSGKCAFSGGKMFFRGMCPLFPHIHVHCTSVKSGLYTSKISCDAKAEMWTTIPCGEPLGGGGWGEECLL